MEHAKSQSSAAQQVLDWVRSKNPQTMELKFGCKVRRKSWKNPHTGEGGDWEYFTIVSVPGQCRNRDEYTLTRDGEYWSHKELKSEEILGSDMGLQELLIALRMKDKFLVDGSGSIGRYGLGELTKYDLTKNLHEQEPSFYESILPLLPTS